MANATPEHPQVPAATQTTTQVVEAAPNLTQAFGPKPVITGEDEAVYCMLYNEFRSTLAPTDVIEKADCDRMADIQWEYARVRRLRVQAIRSMAYLGLRAALRPILEPDARNDLVRKWVSGDKEAEAKVNELLSHLGPVDDVIAAYTVVEIFATLEGFDRVLAKLEQRLDASLSKFERRREALARRARQALADVEDAEIITTPPVTKAAA